MALKSVRFFGGQKIRISARKSVFSYGTPFFVKGAFVTLGVGSVLAPTYLVYDFSFPSYGRFREPGRRSKKSSPTPLWGHRLPVTALALSARGLDKPNETLK